MKKIILLLFLILNTLIFINIKEVYEKQDVADIVSQFSDPSLPATVITIRSNLEVESHNILNLFKELTEEYDAMIFSYDEKWNRETNTFHYLVELSGKIDERLNLVTEQSLDFNESTEFFYSNQVISNPNSVPFYLLNKNVDVRLYPMEMMGETLNSGEYIIITSTKADMDQVVEKIVGEFEDIIGRVSSTSIDAMNANSEIVDKTALHIVICLIGILLILMMYVYSQTKKIAMLKTLGFSFFRTIRQLFLPILLQIILTIFLVNAFLFFFEIRALNIRTMPIIFSLLKTGLQQLIGTALVFILSSILLVFIPNYSLIKNNNLNYYLMQVNYLMKILILIFFLPMLENHIVTIKESSVMINQMRPLAELKNYQTAIGLKAQYASDGYDLALYVQEFDQEEDVNLLEKYEILNEYHEAYQLLNQAGAIFCNPFFTMGGIPGLNVNENYLEKHPILDVEGQVLDMSLINDEIIYLVPVAYAETFGNDDFDLGAFGKNYTVVFIQDEQFTPDYSFSTLGEGVPLVLTVFGDETFRIDKSPFNHVYLEGDFNEILKDTGFADRMTLRNIGEWLEIMNSGITNQIRASLLNIIPVFGLILTMTIQYAYFYLKVFQKRIYIKRINGHNDFKIFSQFLVESLLSILIAFLIAIAKGFEFQVLFIIIILDIFVYLGTVFISRYKTSMVQ